MIGHQPRGSISRVAIRKLLMIYIGSTSSIVGSASWKTPSNYLKDQFGRGILAWQLERKGIYRAPSMCQEVTYMTSFLLCLGSHGDPILLIGKN